MARTKEFTDEDIIKALNVKKGYIYNAARYLGCSHTTIFKRMKENPAIKEIVDELRGRKLDNAELKLEQAVARDEPWAIAFLLKTLGKDRGYTERQEFSGVDGKPIEITTIEVIKPELKTEIEE